MKKKDLRPGKAHGPAGALVILGILLSLLSITFDLRTNIPTLLTALWVEFLYAREDPRNAPSTEALLRASRVSLNSRHVSFHSPGDGPPQQHPAPSGSVRPGMQEDAPSQE